MTRFLALTLALGLAGPAAAADFGGGADAPYAGPDAADTWLMIGPGWDYQPITAIPPHAQVRVIFCEHDSPWCYAAYGRRNGWVYAGYAPGSHVMRYWPFGH